MENKKKVLVTGACGFIGSNFVKFLNAKGITPFVYDPKLTTSEQWKNLAELNFEIVKDALVYAGYDAVIHLGANSATTTPMSPELFESNAEFSQKLFNAHGGKFIYASSAATYGAEEKDFTERVEGLKPTNAYGFLKLYFDKWITRQSEPGRNFIGLRFFNVYGPGEGFKGEMASVVHKALNGLKPICNWKNVPPESGNDIETDWFLFKSYKDGVADGEQKRDFVYVEDVCKVIWHFIENNAESGIYNLGSGKARSFVDLVRAVDASKSIRYIAMPESIRPHYQYFTEANLTKLRAAGYKDEFTSLEDGIKKMKEAK